MATSLPSHEKPAATTLSVCPASVAIRAPVAVDHRYATSSPPPETATGAVGDTATQYTLSVCPSNRATLLSGPSGSFLRAFS